MIIRTARNKKRLWKLLPLARAIGVMSAVGIATTLVTFAAIQSNGNALAGNTIQTATAALMISTNGTDFLVNVPGFNFTGLIPGGDAQPVANNYTVHIKNIGTANLKLALSVPAQPTVVGAPDLSKVSVLLTPPAVVGFPAPATQTIPLSDLIAGKVSLNNSAVGASGGTVSFRVQVYMAADAFTGSSASISDLNLSFSGSPQ